MTYPAFVGGTAATILDNTPSSTTLAYPAGISPNDLVLVSASWGGRTVYWPPAPYRYPDNPRGWLNNFAGNYQSTRSIPGVTDLGAGVPMEHNLDYDTAPYVPGQFISWRMWVLRNAELDVEYLGTNLVTDGMQGVYTMMGVEDRGGVAAAADVMVLFGASMRQLPSTPTPSSPVGQLVSWSPHLVDVGSLNGIGAGEPLGFYAWLALIPAGAALSFEYTLRLAGCAGHETSFDRFSYYIGYHLDPDAPPVGECPARQAAATGANTLRVRAHA